MTKPTFPSSLALRATALVAVAALCAACSFGPPLVRKGLQTEPTWRSSTSASPCGDAVPCGDVVPTAVEASPDASLEYSHTVPVTVEPMSVGRVFAEIAGFFFVGAPVGLACVYGINEALPADASDALLPVAAVAVMIPTLSAGTWAGGELAGADGSYAATTAGVAIGAAIGGAAAYGIYQLGSLNGKPGGVTFLLMMFAVEAVPLGAIFGYELSVADRLADRDQTALTPSFAVTDDGAWAGVTLRY